MLIKFNAFLCFTFGVLYDAMRLERASVRDKVLRRKNTEKFAQSASGCSCGSVGVSEPDSVLGSVFFLVILKIK